MLPKRARVFLSFRAWPTEPHIYPQKKEHPHHKSKSTLKFKRTSKSMCFAHFCKKRNLYAIPFLSFQFHQMNFFCLFSMWYPFNKLILNCEWVNSTTRINICEISWYHYYYHCYIILGILVRPHKILIRVVGNRPTLFCWFAWPIGLYMHGSDRPTFFSDRHSRKKNYCRCVSFLLEVVCISIYFLQNTSTYKTLQH